MGSSPSTVHPQHTINPDPYSKTAPPASEKSQQLNPVKPIIRSSYQTIDSPPTKIHKSISLLEPSNGLSRFGKTYSESDGLVSDQQKFEEIYDQCDGKIDEYFNNLQEPIAMIYTKLTKQTLDGMNNHTFVNYEDKIHISETILKTNLKILKIIGRKTQHKFDMQIYVKFNKMQSRLIEYLKTKYPRSAQNFVPGELMKVFKQFSNVEKPENDILKNSGNYFKSYDEPSVIKSVKQFINNLIDECDTHFHKFQKLFQDRVFQIVQGEKVKTVNYKIGRKLPENTPKFTDMSGKSLDIKSPELFRVCIKWVQAMENMILDAQTVKQKQTLKIVNFHGGKYIFDQISTEVNETLVYEIIAKLQNEKEEYIKDIQKLISEMHLFNNNLIRILDQGERKQKFIMTDEAQMIKFASSNTKLLQWMLAEKLMIILKRLIKIGKSFQETDFMMPIDLIQFQVTDMMRCLMTGSKKDVLAVYENIKKLEEEGLLEVIKVKNRLSTPLNDAMIIFKLKGCFLICELQLILAESSQGVADKLKNIENLNHFFYELERSPYGLLPELAVLMGYKDSRVTFANKIHYTTNYKFSECEKNHAKSIITTEEQLYPFMCSQCCIHYSRLQNLFIMKECQQCNTYICSKCIFKEDESFFQKIRKSQLSNYIQKQIAKTVEQNRNKKDFNANCIQLNLILEKFDLECVLMKNIVKDAKGSITMSQFENFLKETTSNKLQNNRNIYHWYCIWVQISKNELKLTPLILDILKSQVKIAFNSNEDLYQNGGKIKFGQYDYLLFYKQPVSIEILQQDQFKVLTSINIFPYKTEVEKGGYAGISLGDHGFFLVDIIEQKIKNVTDAQNDESSKKEFKYASIGDYLSNLPDLKNARSIILLSNLGLKNNHLSFFQTVAWKAQIKELRISKNKILDIQPVIDSLDNLEKIYCSQNYLTQIKFGKKKNFLKIAVFSANKIKEIIGIQNIPAISRLDLEKNKLVKFPKATLSDLRFLLLSENQMKDFQELMKSKFDNLLQLSLLISFELGTNLPANFILPFQNLNILKASQVNSSHLEIKSKKLERLECTSCSFVTLSIISPNLKSINLSSNGIEDFSPLFSTQMPFLQKISFGYNKFQIFPKMNCKNLQSIDATSTGIKNIDNLQLSKIPNLKFLNLQSNLIETLCKLDFLNLKQFRISYNPLKNIQKLQQSNLDNLEYFNLPLVDVSGELPRLSLKNATILTFSDFNVNIGFSKVINWVIPNVTSLTINSGTAKEYPSFSIPKLQSFQSRDFNVTDFCNFGKVNFPQLKTLTIEALNNSQGQSESALTLPVLNFPQATQMRFDSSFIKNADSLSQSNIRCLQILSFSYCKLQGFPKIDLPFLKTLSLDSNQLCDISDLLNSNLPILQTLNLQNNKIEIFNNHKHDSNPKEKYINNFKFTTVKELSLGNNLLKEMKLENIPSVTTLSFSSCKFEEFPILNAPELVSLSFDVNPLKSFANLSKCKLPKLESLSNGYGMDKDVFIETIFPKIDFPSVTYLSFCSLGYKDVTNLGRSNLPMLEVLVFAQNELTEIPVLRFPKLKTVQLNNNKIKEASALAVSTLDSLEVLNLSSNQIEKLPKFKAEYLTSLNLATNKLRNLQELRQCKFLNLTSIQVTDNPQFHEEDGFPETLKNLTLSSTKTENAYLISRLKVLQDLTSNTTAITHLPPFASFKTLISISLVENSICDLKEFFSTEFSVLSAASFNKNKIKQLPKMSCFELASFSAQENEIQNVEQFLNSNIPKLSSLFLTKNKIKTISKLSFPLINSLSLGNNELQSIQFLQKLSDNTFYYLNLSNNKICKIKPMGFYTYGLELQNNKISNLDWLQKSNFKYVSSLDLSNNEIKKFPKLPKCFTSCYTINISRNSITDFSALMAMKKDDFPNIYQLTITIPENEDRAKFSEKLIQELGLTVQFMTMEGQQIFDQAPEPQDTRTKEEITNDWLAFKDVEQNPAEGDSNELQKAQN